MNDKVINEIKLISFYQSLPDELLGKAIANLDANRHYRRGLSKIKNNAEKVSMIMREPALRKSMTYNVYDLVKEQIPLSIENADYDTIVSSINEENNICIAFSFSDGAMNMIKTEKAMIDISGSSLIRNYPMFRPTKFR